MSDPQDANSTPAANLDAVLQAGVVGDLYLSAQRGGIAGGHGNANVLHEGKGECKGNLKMADSASLAEGESKDNE